MSERGWVTVENIVEIARSPEDVFDYLTDMTNEAEWNPRTRRVAKLTPGSDRPGHGIRRGVGCVRLGGERDGRGCR